MKFSEKWLREWVNPPIDTNTLADRLTQAGLEVDAAQPVAGTFSSVFVGKVMSVASHPNADKLKVCQVDIGRLEALSIVCGASNVRPELKMPVAVVGAVLPNNTKIKKAKLRGVVSYGMLCSGQELGLEDHAGGLLELAEDAPVGMDIRDYLNLDDVIITLDLTPNRGDCLSIAGVAREVSALTGCDVMQHQQPVILKTSNTVPKVSVDNPVDCPIYMARVIENININARSPLWIQEKLRRIGLRSLGAVVDITNYVMFELGQPLHAFDLAALDGDITVRSGRQNEEITLLNGQRVTVSDDTLVIADQSSILALAGIMGGQASSVSQNTQHILLEAAFFKPSTIAGRARYYGLHTDASHRFERGVDPALVETAMDRVTALLTDIVSGDAGPITTVFSVENIPKAAVILLRRDRIKRVLGIDINPDEVKQQLTRLGLSVLTDGEDWQVTIPSFRFDLAIEADLIEELGRLYGYDKLPKTRPQIEMPTTVISERTLSVHRLQSLLVDRGYQEAITYSFVDPAIEQHLGAKGKKIITLANPISTDLSAMRTSLWSGLVQALVHNLNRQHQRIRLFEVGCVFSGDNDHINQHNQVAGIICGSRYAEQWGAQQRPVDFFDLKADVEALLALDGNGNVHFISEQHPALHPGQSARIYRGEKAVGWLGALHPKLNVPLAIDICTYLFELNLSAALCRSVPKFTPLSKFPMIRRDLALIVDNNLSANQIVSCLNTVKSDIVKEIQVFDVYSGAGVKLGEKSIAVSCHLQHSERTLTEEEVDRLMDTLIHSLHQQIGATIRS